MIQLDWRDLIGVLGCLLVIGSLAWMYFPAAPFALGVLLLVVYYLQETRSAAQSPTPTASESDGSEG